MNKNDLPEVPEATPFSEPWGYEGQGDRHAPIGDVDYWDNYPDDGYTDAEREEYEREYPILPMHVCRRGVACPDGCEAEPIDMYEPR